MLKVLVVDDEMFVRKGLVMETDWKALGFVVAAEAENGLEALDAVHKYQPDLIICDIRMPKMTGLEMLKVLRSEGNQVHVIFLTAYSEFEYAKEALKLYAFDYLLKPFEDGELEAAVTRAKKAIEAKQGERKRLEEEKVLSVNETGGSKSRYIREAIGYIGEHYAESDIMTLLSDCRNKVYEVAEKVGYKDITYFSSTFKKIVGMSPSDYQDRT